MFAIIFCINSVLCSNSNQTDLSYPSDKHLTEFLCSKGFTNLEENFHKEILDHFVSIFSLLNTNQNTERLVFKNEMDLKQAQQEYADLKKASDEFNVSNNEIYKVFMFQYHNKNAKTKTIFDENGKEKLVFDDDICSEPTAGHTANPSLTINKDQKKPIPKYTADQIISGLNMCKEKQEKHNRFMERANQEFTQKTNLLQKTINQHKQSISNHKKQIITNCTAIYNKLHTLNRTLDKDEIVIDLHRFCWDIQKTCNISGFIVGTEILHVFCMK